MAEFLDKDKKGKCTVTVVWNLLQYCVSTLVSCSALCVARCQICLHTQYLLKQYPTY